MQQLIRLQHGIPHKEYFQNPSQMPLPENVAQTGQDSSASALAHTRTLFRRILTTTGLATLSLLFGLGGGTSLITWAYMQGTFEAGTEEENEMMDEITELMNEYAAMDELLNDPEWEELPVTPRMVSGESGKGLNFVTGTLVGSKGIIQVVLSIPLYLTHVDGMAITENLLSPYHGGVDRDCLLWERH